MNEVSVVSKRLSELSYSILITLLVLIAKVTLKDKNSKIRFFIFVLYFLSLFLC